MEDKVEKIGESVIQHGPLSNRIYLMKPAGEDFPGILEKLDELCGKAGYTKIIAKTSRALSRFFQDNGYRNEASVPGFYNGIGDTVFFAKYFDKQREIYARQKDNERIINMAQQKPRQKNYTLPEGFDIHQAKDQDVDEMADVYRCVFPTYPFPIHDSGYLLQTMKTNVDYFCVCHRDRIVALASAEKDETWRNVEMTDFATLPEFRGKGLALALLAAMEKHMTALEYPTAYTIARAISPGINITFTKSGYTFGGTLINNTNIGGQIESMNVWYKRLA